MEIIITCGCVYKFILITYLFRGNFLKWNPSIFHRIFSIGVFYQYFYFMQLHPSSTKQCWILMPWVFCYCTSKISLCHCFGVIRQCLPFFHYPVNHQITLILLLNVRCIDLLFSFFTSITYFHLSSSHLGCCNTVFTDPLILFLPSLFLYTSAAMILPAFIKAFQLLSI